MTSPRDTIQDYFDALLGAKPTSSPEEKAPGNNTKGAAEDARVLNKTQKLAEPESNSLLQESRAQTPKVAPKSKSQVHASASPKLSEDAEHAVLEAKKQKLQQLLNQQTIKVAAPAQAPDETQAKLAPSTDDITDLDTAVEPTEETYDSFHSQLGQDTEWAKNGRPKWAQDRFDALLFDVAGLTLAVPLVALGQIVPINKDVTPIFGQADWFMGLLPTALGKLRVVNTALFVMPEKYSDAFLESAAYAISLDGVSWALAVDKVNQPISLDPNEIKWRGERSRRPWLAGTVKSAMCALIDIPNMARLLSESENSAKPSALRT